MALDVSTDYAALDGLIGITLDGGAVANVLMCDNVTGEGEPSEGAYLHRDVEFQLPTFPAVTPVVGSVIEAPPASGILYNVLAVRDPWLGDYWGLTCREAAITADVALRDTVTLYPAVVTGDSFGSRIANHDVADPGFTDVPAKVQIQPASIGVAAGKKQFKRRFDIFVAQDVDVHIGDLLKDQNGIWYDIVTWRNRKRIDELSVIEVEYKD